MATNLALWSEDFTNLAWRNGVGIPTANNIAVAPDGTMTAEQITAGYGAAACVKQILRGLTPGQVYTSSIWVKKGSTSPATNIRGTINDTAAWNTGPSVQFPLSDLFSRVSFQWTQPANRTNAAVMWGLITASAGGDDSCAGNILIWGGQVNPGATLDAYVKTTTTALTVADPPPSFDPKKSSFFLLS